MKSNNSIVIYFTGILLVISNIFLCGHILYGQDNYINGTTSFGSMNASLEESAKKHLAFSESFGALLKGNSPSIERFAQADYCMPKDIEEYNLVGGMSLILITAISQVKEELPLKKVYVLKNKKGIELKRIKMILSKQSKDNSIVAKVYGSYRMDGLYTIPSHLLSSKPTLLIDFAKNRRNFEIMELGPIDVNYKIRALNSNPQNDALDTFAKREYPGFF